jgi:tight adherence protein B
MNPLLIAALSALLGFLLIAGVSLAARGVRAAGTRSRGPLGRYLHWWRVARLEAGMSKPWAYLPLAQLLLVAGAALWAALTRGPAPLLLALAAIAAPYLAARQAKARRRQRLGEQLGNTLIALANALTTTPNLGEALRSLLLHIDPPMRDEISKALAETDLGQPLDRALTEMAQRLEVPGLETAISAALLGQRTGGDLPAILRRIAAALQEMERLQGVVRTKTAEGRNQAWVMGAMPILLVVALEKIDPEWLAPLWNDPLGWIILGLAGLFELSAIFLIRRITAVDI